VTATHVAIRFSVLSLWVAIAGQGQMPGYAILLLFSTFCAKHHFTALGRCADLRWAIAAALPSLE
jgi:hypothetical protein